jgi:hypothetical protein
MQFAVHNTKVNPAETGGIGACMMFSPLVNNSVIIKKNVGSKFAFRIHQGQFMIGFDGNPLKGEIFFMMADDPK